MILGYLGWETATGMKDLIVTVDDQEAASYVYSPLESGIYINEIVISILINLRVFDVFYRRVEIGRCHI